MHPEMKKFQIMTPVLFAPPNPDKTVGSGAINCGFGTPSFAQFFTAYFGGATYNLGDAKCGKMLEGMKRCYENNSSSGADPVGQCTYYIDGFRRMACSKQ